MSDVYSVLYRTTGPPELDPRTNSLRTQEPNESNSIFPEAIASAVAYIATRFHWHNYGEFICIILKLWFLSRIISCPSQYANYKYTVLHPGILQSISFVPAHFFVSSTSYILAWGINNLAGLF